MLMILTMSKRKRKRKCWRTKVLSLYNIVSVDNFFFVKMSEMGFYLLPTGKLHEKAKKRRLKNFPAGYVGSFYRNLVDNVENFIGSDFYGRIANDSNIPAEDVQKYILATSDFAKGMQSDINHYVTKDKINNASFRQKFDPISKNILGKKILWSLFLKIFLLLMQKTQ